MSENHHKITPWIIWSLGAAFFFCEYFARVSTSVMAPDLLRDLHTDAYGIGTLSAFFYISYLGMQLPVGLLIDRFSIRKLLIIATLACAIGSIGFGQIQNVVQGQLFRFIIGFGAAFAFISALKLALMWLPLNRFGLFAGITQALGMLGAATGEAPLATLVVHAGWRHAMNIIALIFFILAILIYIFVKDKPAPNHSEYAHKQAHFLSSLKLVLANRQVWWNGLAVGFLYAPTAAFAELWGASFIHTAHHIPIQQAAFSISLIFIGWGIGGPLAGWISDRIQRRKPIMIFSAICGFILMTTVFYVPNLPRGVVYVLMFLYGMTNTGIVMNYAVASEIVPAQVSGTSLGFANIASVIIGAGLQPVIGRLLDGFATGLTQNGTPIYTAHDYRLALIVLPICFILSLAAQLFLKETYCLTAAQRKKKEAMAPQPEPMISAEHAAGNTP